MTYAEKLRDPRWQKKRLEIFHRDDFACQLCGSSAKELQVHHKRYISKREPWEYENADLTALCRECHEKATSAINNIWSLISAFDIRELIDFSSSVDAARENGHPDSILAWYVSQCLTSPRNETYTVKETQNLIPEGCPF